MFARILASRSRHASKNRMPVELSPNMLASSNKSNDLPRAEIIHIPKNKFNKIFVINKHTTNIITNETQVNYKDPNAAKQNMHHWKKYCRDTYKNNIF